MSAPKRTRTDPDDRAQIETLAALAAHVADNESQKLTTGAKVLAHPDNYHSEMARELAGVLCGGNFPPEAVLEAAHKVATSDFGHGDARFAPVAWTVGLIEANTKITGKSYEPALIGLAYPSGKTAAHMRARSTLQSKTLAFFASALVPNNAARCNALVTAGVRWLLEKSPENADRVRIAMGTWAVPKSVIEDLTERIDKLKGKLALAKNKKQSEDEAKATFEASAAHFAEDDPARAPLDTAAAIAKKASEKLGAFIKAKETYLAELKARLETEQARSGVEIPQHSAPAHDDAPDGRDAESDSHSESGSEPVSDDESDRDE